MFHFLGVRIELLSVLPHGEDHGIALTLSQGASIPEAFIFFFFCQVLQVGRWRSKSDSLLGDEE